MLAIMRRDEARGDGDETYHVEERGAHDGEKRGEDGFLQRDENDFKRCLIEAERRPRLP